MDSFKDVKRLEKRFAGFGAMVACSRTICRPLMSTTSSNAIIANPIIRVALVTQRKVQLTVCSSLERTVQSDRRTSQVKSSRVGLLAVPRSSSPHSFDKVHRFTFAGKYKKVPSAWKDERSLTGA